MATVKPRRLPDGGFLCERGTLGPHPCPERATWRIGNEPATAPGAVVCDKHRMPGFLYVPLPGVIGDGEEDGRNG